MREVLTFILAGGKGERLNPLTRDRAKPAVPFGGVYRIVDFTLSNCINSGLRRVYLLIQYKSFSLQKHLLSGWDVVSNQLGEFIDVIPAQQRINSDWYKGTADAIYQNIYAIQDQNPAMILILAGDHIYKMDYQQMIKSHQEQKADMTVACIPMPVETSLNFGVVEVDDQNRICGFQEKPKKPRTIPGHPDKIFASMGIYLFNKDVLLSELETDARTSFSEHDFGKNVIPQMVKNHRNVFVYNFIEKESCPYWRDIGTRDAYYQANMDLLGPRPAFDLYDRKWPVWTFHEQQPPIRTMTANDGKSGVVINSLIAGGCTLKGADVIHSVLSSNVLVDEYAVVTNSILMDNVVIGHHAKIKNAILDKEVVVSPYAEVGYDPEADRKRFEMTASGVVIISKRTRVE